MRGEGEGKRGEGERREGEGREIEGREREGRERGMSDENCTFNVYVLRESKNFLKLVI